MKPVFEKIRQLASPYLDTRHNDVHTAISTRLAFELLDRERGDEDIVIPAILLHDTGWKRVPHELHLKAFGPNASQPELNRLHEIEGVNIAEDILRGMNYDAGKTNEVLEIIDGHDSRTKPLSLNDMIVKDADKLWRFCKSGFYIDIQRFGESHMQGVDRLRNQIFGQLFTATAREMATEKLVRRENEKTVEHEIT